MAGCFTQEHLVHCPTEGKGTGREVKEDEIRAMNDDILKCRWVTGLKLGEEKRHSYNSIVKVGKNIFIKTVLGR